MQTDRLLLIKIAKVIKRELANWRGSLEYTTLETFVGCVLAELKNNQLITPWEESVLRQKLED